MKTLILLATLTIGSLPAIADDVPFRNYTGSASKCGFFVSACGNADEAAKELCYQDNWLHCEVISEDSDATFIDDWFGECPKSYLHTCHVVVRGSNAKINSAQE